MDQPQNYALVDDGVVYNIIWMLRSNEQDFPDAVCMGDLPIRIGDTYQDGVFYHDGEPVST